MIPLAWRVTTAALACAAAGLGLAGCGSAQPAAPAAPAALSGDKVADQISARLAEKVGRKPEKVTCPELGPTVGTKIVCQLTDGGKTYDVAVSTTNVTNGQINFGFQVAKTPVGAPAGAPAVPTVRGADVATQVTTKWKAQNGRTPTGTTCPDLRGEVGTKVVCQLTDRGKAYDVTVTTTVVTGNNVKFKLASKPR